jgi:alpha,alpha-trehalose phosphorylase
VCAAPPEAGQLGVSTEVMAGWRDAADKMTIPFDEHLGVHPQAEGFTHHKSWDFSTTDPAARPLFLHYPYFDLYRKQVVKQADLVLALHLCGDYFTPSRSAATSSTTRRSPCGTRRCRPAPRQSSPPRSGTSGCV